MKNITISVTNLDEPILLRDFLQKQKISHTLVKKAKRTGIFVNGVPVTVRYTVKNGDTVLLMLPDEKSEGIPPINIPLKIIYEDEFILVVDKPKICQLTLPAATACQLWRMP